MSLRSVNASDSRPDFAPEQSSTHTPENAQGTGTTSAAAAPDPGVFAHSEMWQRRYAQPSHPAATSAALSTMTPTGNTAAPARPKTLAALTAADLAAMSDAEKRALLEQLGVPAKHLKKSKGAKLEKALLAVIAALQSPGTHKLTLKLDKKYAVKLKVGADGAIEAHDVKQKKGFLSKLGGVLKMVAPIAGILLAPVTGGLSLIASSALGAIDAVKNKNWLGAIASVAGAFVPGTGSFLSSAVGAAGKTAALAGQSVARVATAVQQGAFAVQAGMMALKAKSPGALLGAMASGVGAFAGGVNQATGKLAQTAQRVQQWGHIAWRGESIIRAAKSGDWIGAATGALGAAAGVTGLTKDDSRMARDLERYSAWAGRAEAARWALKTRNYAGAAAGALALARDIRVQGHGGGGIGVDGGLSVGGVGGDKWGRVLRLVEGGARLEGALRSRDATRIAQAGLQLSHPLICLSRGRRLSGSNASSCTINSGASRINQTLL